MFVHDRGKGFDPEAVPSDRNGIAQSIRARMTRAGGLAAIRSEIGVGTEVQLVLPRRPALR
jgi:signal transduction histidine kinase